MQNYEIIRPIGKGSFGRVYLVKHKIERKQYCMKSIKLEDIPASERKACQTEVKLMETMMHPNIVGFKESFVARGGKLLCIVMTYCDGGDLADRLKQNGGRLFKEDQILHWFVQLALGLHFMHEMNDKCILHRDLKTQNIFLLGNGRLVIGDLGISKALDASTDFTKTTIGTPYYMSPEVYKSRPYNHKSDVWSLGCVLYEMVTLKHAFNAKSLNGLMGKVVKGRYEPIPRTYSKSLGNLVDKMLSLDPSSRPSLQEILSQSFIKRHVFQFLRDIADRPTAQLGDGTMVLRKAALGAAGARLTGFGGDDLMLQQTQSLKKQLESLGMADILQKAFQDTELSPGPPYPNEVRNVGFRNSPKENAGSSSNIRESPRGHELRKAAKEQRNALLIERERKRAVESALEKLRKERELRAKERLARIERQRKRDEYASNLKRQEEREKQTRLEKQRKEMQEHQRRAAERERRSIGSNAPFKASDMHSNRTRTSSSRSPSSRRGENRRLSQLHPVTEENKSYPLSGLSVQAASITPVPRQNRVLRSPRTPPFAADSPPPPPPPSSQHRIVNHRDKMLAMKAERLRESEKNQRDLLMKAAQERMIELRNAQEMHHNQFHRPASKPIIESRGGPISSRLAQMKVEDDFGIDEEVEEEAEPQSPEENGLESPQSIIGFSNQVEDDVDVESDCSSLPEAMPELDSEDDDLDNQEVELRMELQAATIRCSSIKKTLRVVQAELKSQGEEGKEVVDSADGDDDSYHDHAEDDDEDDEEGENEAEEHHEQVFQVANRPGLKNQPIKQNNWVAPLKEDEEEDEQTSDSEESSDDDGLFSPVLENASGFVAPQRGGLKSRIQILEEECVRALGKKRFEQVYGILKSNLEHKLGGPNSGRTDKSLHDRIHALLARDGKLAYWTKIDNLIFMQEAI